MNEADITLLNWQEFVNRINKLLSVEMVKDDQCMNTINVFGNILVWII